VEDAILVYLSDRSITKQSIMKRFVLSRNTVKKYAGIVKKKMPSAG
jgi:DNA-binding CsgD family transcriptional regulator